MDPSVALRNQQRAIEHDGASVVMLARAAAGGDHGAAALTELSRGENPLHAEWPHQIAHDAELLSAARELLLNLSNRAALHAGLQITLAILRVDGDHTLIPITEDIQIEIKLENCARIQQQI